MCYIYCTGLKITELQYIELVNDAIEEKVLDNDCTVSNANLFLNWLTNKNYIVTKYSLNRLSEIKTETPVRFDYNGNSHWVVVKNGKIVFNPLKESICVKYGKPTTARIIKGV